MHAWAVIWYVCNMSMQTLLQHSFGVRDQEYLKTEYHDGHISIHIKSKADKLRCSACGSANVVRKGKVQREFRTVGIGLKPVFLVAEVCILKCKDCGKQRKEKIHSADEKKHLPMP